MATPIRPSFGIVYFAPPKINKMILVLFFHSIVQVEFENAYILVCQKAVSTITQIMPVLEHVARHGNRPLLIVADDVDGMLR